MIDEGSEGFLTFKVILLATVPAMWAPLHSKVLNEKVVPESRWLGSNPQNQP